MDESLKCDLFKDLFIILEASSSKCKVLDEKFPAEFFESNPKMIYESYIKFLEDKSEGGSVNLEEEGKLQLTTIRERFETGKYSQSKDDIYRLYHDIRLVSIMLIQYYSPGTRSYQMVDKFYKFATELLLRECYKYGVTLLHSEPSVKNKEDTEFFDIISKDFIKISSSYTLPIVESYHITTKFGDLFSSTISSSQLDQRPPDLPNSNFEVTKIIPQTGSRLSNKLGFIAANTSNIPDPTLPPTEMMTKFLHPNWYALPTTLWLKYGGYESFAPTITENGSVVDSSRIGDIWLEKSGYLELWKLNSSGDEENEEILNAEKNAQQESEHSTEMRRVNGDSLEQPKTNGIQFIEEKPMLPSSPKPVNINLESLYKWTPADEIDDDEIQAFRDNTQHKLISKTLVQLQEMKRKRIQVGKVSKPTSQETRLYFKAQRMLKEVILSKQVRKVPKMHIREFPVLQANYAGSIPVVRTYPNRKKKYKK
ncbi:Rsc58p Ecym_6075 [Eremothecium cymbalariae DBVPG|uniref:Bromo domain-containing protein n=1 Tax=Eremothecium cymbalariae (strain CBS 270.75 / DBVPG 7215 / KCTC 17166 / NRRL Y-17582) TaxID=931890 RepID=G8JUZ4_ERECY|nr:hypothetical protein Ecym_6075 [Eremothecium cymbalariae DBVPG\